MNAIRTTALLSLAMALVFAAATAHAQEAARKGQPTQAETRSALDGAAAQWDKTCRHDQLDAHGFCATYEKVKDQRRCGGEYVKVTIKRKVLVFCDEFVQQAELMRDFATAVTKP